MPAAVGATGQTARCPLSVVRENPWPSTTTVAAPAADQRSLGASAASTSQPVDRLGLKLVISSVGNSGTGGGTVVVVDEGGGGGPGSDDGGVPPVVGGAVEDPGPGP